MNKYIFLSHLPSPPPPQNFVSTVKYFMFKMSGYVAVYHWPQAPVGKED